MKKYLVKVTYTATENNKNFAGETHVYYEGKEEKTIGKVKINSIGKVVDSDYFLWWLDEYGYNRVCDAKRNYHFHNPTEESINGVVMWEKKVEIVKASF